MKKTERVLVALSAISTALHVAAISGGSQLSFLSLTTLSLFYYAFSFALLNGIGFRGLFRKVSYKGISAMRIIGAVCAGMTISTLAIALLFAILNYEGASNMLLSGLVPAVIILLISIIKYMKNKHVFYKGVILRVSLACVAGILPFLIDMTRVARPD